jgi:ATP-dependent Lhr-like helicase
VKARSRKNPSGILLITPESLEAMLVRRGKEVARLFRVLSHVVIDEMHVFLDDPRGKQLQSVLHRIDLAAQARPVRVGLSATLADEEAARAFLRPLEPNRVDVLPPGPGGPQIMLQMRGYIRPANFRHQPHSTFGKENETVLEDPADTALIRHLFATCRENTANTLSDG